MCVCARFTQDCQDSLQNSEPEIKFALEYGEHMIDDDLTDAEDKEKVQKDVKELEEDLKNLEEEAAKETIRYSAFKVSTCTGERKIELWEWLLLLFCFCNL